MATPNLPTPPSTHRRMPYPRIVLLAAGTLVVLSALTYGIIRSTQPPAPDKYLTAAIHTGSLVQTDSATGEVVPAETDPVSVPTNAAVTQLDVHLGEAVSAGTTLATFSDPTLAAEVASQQAAVAAQANQVSLLTSSSYAASQQDAITQAQDNLTQAEDTLASDRAAGTVATPAGGTVSHLVAVGTVVTSGQTVAVVTGKNVEAPVAGTVQAVYVADGDRIGAGAAVLSVTSPALTAKIVGDESHVAGLQGALDKAAAQDSPAQVATAVDQAQAQLARDQQTLTQEQQALSKLVVTAPFAGEITTLDPATPAKLLTLSSASLLVTIPIPETQVAVIHAGQPVNLSLPALPGTAVSGTVQSIAPVGVYSNGISNFPVNVTVSNPGGVRYGMSAQVGIVVHTVHHALLVPLAAIQTHGSHNFVDLLGANSHVTRAPVHVLLENTTTAAVQSPHLADNDRVITAVLTSSSGKLHLKAKGRAVHKKHAKGKKGGKK